MRVSIPALFMVQIMIQQSLLGRRDMQNDDVNLGKAEVPVTKDGKTASYKSAHAVQNTAAQQSGNSRGIVTGGESKLIRVILIVFLIIGAVVPVQEMLRSIVYTLPPYKYTWSDSIKTLGNDMTSASNFLGLTKDNLFYEYLARKK